MPSLSPDARPHHPIFGRFIRQHRDGARTVNGHIHDGRGYMLRLAVVFLMAMASTALAQTSRTELKRADLTGTDMEIIISVLEVPPGNGIERHIHPGEEAVYVLEGATLQFPDGKEVARPAGQAGVNVRDVPHAGYTVVGDKPLKLLTVHIVDKGKPMTVPAK
jgi:quercetin dioxygenase-like cupin family protein